MAGEFATLVKITSCVANWVFAPFTVIPPPALPLIVTPTSWKAAPLAAAKWGWPGAELMMKLFWSLPCHPILSQSRVRFAHNHPTTSPHRAANLRIQHQRYLWTLPRYLDTQIGGHRVSFVQSVGASSSEFDDRRLAGCCGEGRS